ncbi:hypothetical protein ACMFMG_009526 [Clarireedia jacksonii]
MGLVKLGIKGGLAYLVAKKITKIADKPHSNESNASSRYEYTRQDPHTYTYPPAPPQQTQYHEQPGQYRYPSEYRLPVQNHTYDSERQYREERRVPLPPPYETVEEK